MSSADLTRYHLAVLASGLAVAFGLDHELRRREATKPKVDEPTHLAPPGARAELHTHAVGWHGDELVVPS